VLPYVYLVAISLKENFALLKQAVDVDAPHSRWFKYIGAFLIQSFTPTSRQAIAIALPHPTIAAKLSSAETKIPTSRQTVSVSLPGATIGAKSPSSVNTTVTNIKFRGGK
jgi:hypothetical protein